MTDETLPAPPPDIVGLQATRRDGFPEPTLLPHLARSVAPTRFAQLLDLTSDMAGGKGAFPPWPRLNDAVCAVVAPRLGPPMDAGALGDLLRWNPALFSHLSGQQKSLALDSVVGQASGWYGPDRACALGRLAARFPEEAAFADLATAALLDLDAEDQLGAQAWMLPLTAGRERRSILQAWGRRQWFELDALMALLVAADPAEREGLAALVLRFIETEERPAAALGFFAAVLPDLPPAAQETAARAVAPALPTAADEVPPWWLALVWSRLAGLQSMALPDLPDRFPPQWRDLFRSLGPLANLSGYADVFRAHPGAIQWMAGLAYPGLEPVRAGDLLDAVADRWSGAHAAGAEPPGASETPAPGRVEPPPPSTPPPPPSAPAPSAPPSRPSPVPPSQPPSRPSPAPPSQPSPAPPASAPPRGGGLGGLIGRVGDLVGGLINGVGGLVLGGGDEGEGSAPSTTRGPPREPKPEPVSARRLQTDVWVEEGQQVVRLPGAFVAGMTNRLAVSVGRGAMIQASAAFTEPPVREEAEGETLEFRLIHGQTTSSERVWLPRDTARNSATWNATLAVPADASAVEAMVVVLHNGRVLQAARLSGPATTLNAARAATSGITLEVLADVHGFSDLEGRGSFDAALISDGRTAAAFQGAAVGVRELAGISEDFRKITDKLFKTSEAVAMGDQPADPVAYEKLLLYLAVRGKLLHSVLIRQLMPGLDQARRIQIVSTSTTDILPLEFVYDGPSPTHTATLCPGWREALPLALRAALKDTPGDAPVNGVCPVCGGHQTEGRSDTFCPSRFWALSRIIERYTATGATPAGQDYVVTSRPVGQRRTLAPLTRAVFSASDNVPEDAVEQTLETLRGIVPASVEVKTWDQWADRVRDESPTLLVSMPHNALDPAFDIDTLEIGRGSELRAGEVDRRYVSVQAGGAGPVVLLLGCQTAFGGPRPFHTFVAEFGASGAAVVIGTLATVLGEHAAPIVQAIVTELAAVPAAGPATVGEVLLAMRQQMFSRGIVIALAVAAFGDADWVLTATPQQE